jgi:hypothetical protein
MAGAYLYVAFMGVHSKGWLPALPANMRSAWKWLTMTNTLAYYDTESVTAAKKVFYIQKYFWQKSL